MKPANETIKEARQRLALSMNHVSERSGLSWNEYFDIELHRREAFQVAHLGKMKKLCDVLALGLFDLFGIACEFCERTELAVRAGPAHRNELVRSRREELGLSQDELGDRIGFETIAIKNMESDPAFFDSWSVELVLELAGILGVPPQLLLGVTCTRCGR